MKGDPVGRDAAGLRLKLADVSRVAQEHEVQAVARIGQRHRFDHDLEAAAALRHAVVDQSNAARIDGSRLQIHLFGAIEHHGRVESEFLAILFGDGGRDRGGCIDGGRVFAQEIDDRPGVEQPPRPAVLELQRRILVRVEDDLGSMRTSSLHGDRQRFPVVGVVGIAWRRAGVFQRCVMVRAAPVPVLVRGGPRIARDGQQRQLRQAHPPIGRLTDHGTPLDRGRIVPGGMRVAEANHCQVMARAEVLDLAQHARVAGDGGEGNDADALGHGVPCLPRRRSRSS